MSSSAHLEFELNQAIVGNELVLHYQPIVRVSDRRLVTVEALVRWRHRTRGVLPPSQFVPAIERAGLARELTLWVLREAILQSAVWRTDREPLAVGLNLSAENLSDAHFHRLLEMTLRAVGGRDLLIAEVPGALVASPAQLSGLAEMRERGIRVFIDDVTTPIDLARVPADGVKLGRALVARLPTDEAALEDATVIVRAAKLLGQTVTAVGIEDDLTWRRVVALGCDTAQGYAISEPLSTAGLSAWRSRR